MEISILNICKILKLTRVKDLGVKKADKEKQDIIAEQKKTVQQATFEFPRRTRAKQKKTVQPNTLKLPRRTRAKTNK